VSRTCIVCGGSSHALYSEGVVKCKACGFAFADVDLTEAELFKLYHRGYFFGEEYSNYLADQTAIQKNFKLRLEELKKHLNPSRHKRLLEIGSAYGFFLLLARDCFESVQGIDITEDGVRYCTERLGLNVMKSDLLQTDLGDQKFDVVCLWDTIEHLANPHLYIQWISQHTDSGALLALTTGDIESLNARVKKKNWRLLHPPTHLQYFSRRTIELLLKRNQFEVIYNRPCGFYRSADNISYNLFVLRSGTPSLHQLVTKSGLGRLSFYLNLYDIMYVIARRR
jgi:predicted TPR repeat methyltransferase